MSDRIIGVDYGLKRIGLAVSDPMGIIACGLSTIEASSLRDAIGAIDKVLADFEPSDIIVGMPLTLKGHKGKAAEAVHAFIAALAKVTDIPIRTIDERFTSKLAERTITQMGKSPSRNKKEIDRISASLILQSYLDSRVSTKGHSTQG